MSGAALLFVSLINLITGADSVGSAPKAELVVGGGAMPHQAQRDRARERAGGTGYD